MSSIPIRISLKGWIIISYLCTKTDTSFSQFYRAQSETDTKINQFISQEFAASRLTCGAMCRDKCMSFGYNVKDKICYLHMQSPQNVITEPEEGLVYYQKGEKGCGSEWVEYMNRCYLQDLTKVTWTDAKLFCESRNAHLVEIESKDKSDWLAGTFLLKDTCPSNIYDICVAWTGGNDLVIEGHYQWNNAPGAMNFTNWYPDEPSIGYPGKAAARDCIDLLKNGQWNDRKCSFLNPFICEMT